MKAQFISENLNFERGQKPYDSMGIGKYRDQLIKTALRTNPHSAEDDWSREWLESKLNTNLAEELEHNKYDPLSHTDISSFELDYWIEIHPSPEIDIDDFMAEFMPVGNRRRPSVSGGLNLQPGILPDGSKVIYFEGGLTSGFAARNEWLK